MGAVKRFQVGMRRHDELRQAVMEIVGDGPALLLLSMNQAADEGALADQYFHDVDGDCGVGSKGLDRDFIVFSERLSALLVG